MERESHQVSRGLFLVWNISFNALDSGFRDFLFGPMKSAQFRSSWIFQICALRVAQNGLRAALAVFCLGESAPGLWKLLWLGGSCAGRTEWPTGRMKTCQNQFFALFPAKYQTKHSSTTFLRNTSKKSTFLGFRTQVLM